MDSSTFRNARVVRARIVAPGVRELTLDPGPGFSYVAGQWVSFRIPVAGEDKPLVRAYSIASAPRTDGHFDIAVTRVESGAGSAYLHALNVGDTLVMGHAQGFFTLEPLHRPALMVATGTGVAPLKAMLESIDFADEETPKITLLLGVRTEIDLLYREEFAALAAAHGKFRFEPTLSRSADGWTGRRGYVQTHVAELLASLGTDCDVYVCGLNRMVKEVRRLLRDELGLARERVHTERYD